MGFKGIVLPNGMRYVWRTNGIFRELLCNGTRKECNWGEFNNGSKLLASRIMRQFGVGHLTNEFADEVLSNIQRDDYFSLTDQEIEQWIVRKLESETKLTL